MVPQAWRKAIHLLFILGMAALFSLKICAQERPVVVELFTWESCADCDYAEEAINALRKSYPRDEVIFLTYFRDGENLTPAGVIRPRIYYGLDTKVTPIAMFNGVSRTVGAKSGIITSYRDNIEQRKDWNSSWVMSAWMRIEDASVTASVEWIGEATPEHPLDLHFAWVQQVHDESMCLVRDFQTVGKIQQAQATASITVNPMNLKGSGRLDGFWILQDPQSEEILQAQYCMNLSAFHRDINGDDVINYFDMFYFSSVWYMEDEVADLDQDGIVNRDDFLLFKGPGS